MTVLGYPLPVPPISYGPIIDSISAAANIPGSDLANGQQVGPFQQNGAQVPPNGYPPPQASAKL